MTPAPPPSPNDKNVDVSDVLNDNTPENEGFDPDSVDADFEQELEDLFADDLDDDVSAESHDGPVLLDDIAEKADEFSDSDAVADSVAEADDDDLIVLDDIIEDDEDEPLVLDDVVEEVTDESAAEVEALVDDIAEINAPEPEPVFEADEDAIELDDLVAEVDDSDDELLELDDLLEEASETEVEEDVSSEADSWDNPLELTEESSENMAEDSLLEELEEPAVEAASEPEIEEISFESEDMVDVALAEDTVPEVPVEHAVPEEDIESIMDAPEPEPEQDVINPAVVGNVFQDIRKAEQSAEEMDSELTGLDALEDDAIEDVDSLLDNVEVDVSDVVDVETDDDMDMSDLDMDANLDDVLAAEIMPPDAGHDVSNDVDVDQLLVDVRSEAGEATVADLQDKIAMLESRVEDLEMRLRDEIAQMVPAEAARIIREEIVALASELDD
nr:hypothetical protein [uncultured Pseudodesulfovibrio sp.]